MKLKLNFLLLSLLAFWITASADVDYYYSYTYDNAGNRIERTIMQENTRFESPRHVESHNEITVYPTVTTGIVNIASTLDVMANKHIYCLSSLQGGVLMQGTLTEQLSQLSLPYSPGIYLLNIRTDTTQHTFKIIIQ